jgi:hypothetical protein
VLVPVGVEPPNLLPPVDVIPAIPGLPPAFAEPVVPLVPEVGADPLVLNPIIIIH